MKRWVWPTLAAAVAVVVAIQISTADGPHAVADDPPRPTVAPGTDVLAGIAVIDHRVRDHNYLRAAFGDAWTDENSAPGGHNGCDTRFLGGFDVLRETLQEVGFKQGTLR